MSRSGKFGGASATVQAPQYGGDPDPSDLGGGDGFQGTQDGGSSPGRSPSKQSGGAVVQTLTPVTIRQLLMATQAHPDDIYKVDNRALNQITLVGQVVDLQVQSTNVELQVDDGTGRIGVRMWLDVGEGEAEVQRRWTVGAYVRVIGNLRSFMDARNVLAFRVIPVVNFDEVTYHLLDVINVHLSINEQPSQSSTAPATASARTPGYSQSGRPGGAAPAGRIAGQFTDVQRAVLDVIRATDRRNRGSGCSLGEVVESLSMFSDYDVRDAVAWLEREAHIYAVNDEVWRAAE